MGAGASTAKQPFTEVDINTGIGVLSDDEARRAYFTEVGLPVKWKDKYYRDAEVRFAASVRTRFLSSLNSRARTHASVPRT